MELIARSAFTYGGKSVQRGQAFQAHEADVRVLVAIGKAARAGVESPTAPTPRREPPRPTEPPVELPPPEDEPEEDENVPEDDGGDPGDSPDVPATPQTARPARAPRAGVVRRVLPRKPAPGR